MTSGKTVIFLILALISSMKAKEEFQVDLVIHPVVASLGEPAFYLEEPTMFAISSSNPKVSKHIKQGVALFNAPWDFEAYRHFCAAAKADPDCLMAYWGIVMSLAGNASEFYEQRKHAVQRLLTLLEAEPKVGVEIEQAYALAAVRLVSEGSGKAAETYLKISDNYPADQQSRLLGHFLMRDGYDVNGKPKVRQEVVNRKMHELVVENGERFDLLSFWLMGLSEAPAGAIDLRIDALPVARRLARLNPDFPVYQLTAAHVEARCGNAKLAIAYATKARDLFAKYMKEQKVEVYDCEGWIRAQLYLAHLYTGKGEFQKALPIAKELASYQIEESRLFSRGASLLLWDGRTLGARLYASRSEVKSFDAGIKMLDILPKEQWYEKKSLVGNYRDGLVLYLGARKAIASKDLKAASALHSQMVQRGQIMGQERKLARQTSSFSEWYRAASNLGVMATELQGMMAEKATGAQKMAAVNWYQSAIEQQALPTGGLPPSLSYPVEQRLGWFYIYDGQKQKALETIRGGLKRRPNHLGMLKAYREILARMGKKAEADQIKKTIDLVLQ